MKLIKIIIPAVLVAFLFSCGGNSEHGHHEMDMAEALDVKVDNTIDPICNMEVGGEGTVFDTIHYNEHVFGFCSSKCKEKFAKTPEDYLDKMGN